MFFVSSGAVYAIGPKKAKTLTGCAVDAAGSERRGRSGVAPGLADRARAEAGPDGEAPRPALRRARDDSCARRTATWTLEGLKGTVTDGTFTVASDPVEQAGLIKATVGELKGEARARVVRPLPWTETFESYAGWRRAARLDQRDAREVPRRDAGRPEGAAEGARQLDLQADPHVHRTDGLVELHDRSRRAVQRRSGGRWPTSASRRSATRWSLYGNAQKLKLEPWEPEIHRTVTVPFPWKADTWYHLKLRVENMADGKVRARGKAWPTGQPEPAQWAIDKIDPIGNRQGAPGLLRRRGVRRVFRQPQDHRQPLTGHDVDCILWTG